MRSRGLLVDMMDRTTVLEDSGLQVAVPLQVTVGA